LIDVLGGAFAMVFGLFGGEKEPLKSSLSKDAFMAEFETTMKTFGIEPEKGDKAKDYDKVEATTVPDSFHNTNSINGFRGMFGLNKAII
jgi:hypothetical protein